jgi:hypothetical protein
MDVIKDYNKESNRNYHYYAWINFKRVDLANPLVNIKDINNNQIKPLLLTKLDYFESKKCNVYYK